MTHYANICSIDLYFSLDFPVSTRYYIKQMFDERLFEKGVVMSTQLSFDLEELAQKRVVGLGDYQLHKQAVVKTKRPRLQLVDATYIERARAKTRHPAGSKLPCPPAVGRENRTDGVAAAFDSLPQWARRAPRTNSDYSVPLTVVPPTVKQEQSSVARRPAPQKTRATRVEVPAISRLLAKVSLALVFVAGALIVGAGIGSLWDATTADNGEVTQVAGSGAIAGTSGSSADLLLGQ